MGFLEDFRAGLDRQKAETGRQASWLDPRAWSWPTRIAVGLFILLILLNLAAEMALDIWGPDWAIEGLPDGDDRLPDWEPADPEPIPERPSFRA